MVKVIHPLALWERRGCRTADRGGPASPNESLLAQNEAFLAQTQGVAQASLVAFISPLCAMSA